MLSQSVRPLTQARSDIERAGTIALDHHERAAVLHHGLQSLEDENGIEHDQAEVDAAGRSELRQRIDDIENGKVELLDTDEVFANIRAGLAARRK